MTNAADTTIYLNAHVFTGESDEPIRESFAVRSGRILAAGDLSAVRQAAVRHATVRHATGRQTAGEVAPNEVAAEVDLGGAFVSPGVFEGHAHMLMLGESLDKVQLRDCNTVSEVQAKLTAARAADPDAPRLLGTSWRFDIFEDGDRPTAEMLDAVVADVPVVLDANDLHSVWMNTAAMAAIEIDEDTPNPVGGEIVRDADGVATGFFLETAAVQYAWGYLNEVFTDADRDRFLDNAFAAYLKTGVTGATEMSFGSADLATYRRRLDRDGKLPFPVNAHWMLRATGDADADRAQIDKVARARDEIAEAYGDTWLRIVGVKFILDGVIDACTATMRDPYANGTLPGPIWEREFALPAAVAADAAGLQLALHAIGDEASTIALDMVEGCVRVNGPRANRRARVEHLESVADDTIARMAAIGVTASMQPVHCDPAVLDNWQAMLGDERAHTGFPWHKFREAGVTLALGTDAPTAPHDAPNNLFIALTAKSALDQAREPYQPVRVFTLGDALEALTLGAAFATGREDEMGRIAAGYRANVVVWAANPLTGDPESLRDTSAILTLVDGEVAHTGHA